MKPPVPVPKPRRELERSEREEEATRDDVQERQDRMRGERTVETPQFRRALRGEGIHDVEVGQQPRANRIEPKGEVGWERGSARRRGHADSRENNDAAPEGGPGQAWCAGRRHGDDC